MPLQDLIREIKETAKIVEVIEACGIGEFPTANERGKFRGHHGMHPNGDKSSCAVDGMNNWWKCYSCGQGGDVISWVVSTKYGGNRSCYQEAVYWLASYYGIVAVDYPLDVPRQQAYELLTDLSWHWHEKLMETPEKLEWAMKQWGLTEHTIKDLRLGVCDGIHGAEKTAAMAAGLIDDKGEQPLYNRLVFPYFRDGLVVWASGRLTHDQSKEVGGYKYSSLYANSESTFVRPTLYNYDNAINGSGGLLFTEGLGDAARAHQDGIRVVAVGGANQFTQSYHDDTRRLLKRTAVELADKYITFDTEDSRAGTKGARLLAQALISFGCDPFVVELPLDAGTKKIDLADYLNRFGSESYKAIVADAMKEELTLPTLLINECPRTAEEEQIKHILRVIHPLSKFSLGKYLDQLKNKTRSDIKGFRDELKKIEKENTKIERKIKERSRKPPFYAQDYVYYEDTDIWRAHTCLSVEYEEQETIGGKATLINKRYPVHIAVDMAKDGLYTIVQNEELISPTLEQEKLLPVGSIAEKDNNLWSVDSRFPYSFTNFIAGSVGSVDASDLYKRIRSLFDRHVWLPDPRDKHVLTLYIMMTYIFMGFDAIPYLSFHGARNSGKSTCMDILSSLAFNSVAASTMSSPVLFRAAHGTKATFIIDEAELLKNPAPNSIAHELLSICNGSYSNDDAAHALRCNRDSFQVESWDTYSPKVFGSTLELKSTLRSRAIIIECITVSPGDTLSLDDWYRRKVYLKREMQELRDRLRVWALTQFRTVREVYDVYNPPEADFLFSRDKQIWMPLLAIAKVVSDSWGNDLVPEILECARSKVERVRALEATSDFGNQVLVAFAKCWVQDRESTGYYYAARKKEEAVCTAIAISAIQEKLRTDAQWSDNFNRLNASFFIAQLRGCGAVPAAAKSSSGRVQGQVRETVPFKFAVLLRHLLNQGLVEIEEIGELANGGTSNPVFAGVFDEQDVVSGGDGLEGDSAGHGDNGQAVANDTAGDTGDE